MSTITTSLPDQALAEIIGRPAPENIAEVIARITMPGGAGT